MWRMYHIFKAFSSALRGNLGWAAYHGVKVLMWKTRPKKKHQAKHKNQCTTNDTNIIQGVTIYLKGVDKTSDIERFSMDDDKSLRVKFFDNDTIYTYQPQHYEIKK